MAGRAANPSLVPAPSSHPLPPPTCVASPPRAPASLSTPPVPPAALPTPPAPAAALPAHEAEPTLAAPVALLPPVAVPAAVTPDRPAHPPAAPDANPMLPTPAPTLAPAPASTPASTPLSLHASTPAPTPDSAAASIPALASAPRPVPVPASTGAVPESGAVPPASTPLPHSSQGVDNNPIGNDTANDTVNDTANDTANDPANDTANGTANGTINDTGKDTATDNTGDKHVDKREKRPCPLSAPLQPQLQPQSQSEPQQLQNSSSEAAQSDGPLLKRRRTSHDAVPDPVAPRPAPVSIPGPSSLTAHPEREDFPSATDPPLNCSPQKDSPKLNPGLRAVPASSASGPTPTPMAPLLPMLRSIPVFAHTEAASSPAKTSRALELPPDSVDRKSASASKSTDDPRLESAATSSSAYDCGVAVDCKQAKGGASSGSAKPPKTRKNVSWAPAESLVDYKVIYSRRELIKAWDPETQITLPFSPLQLQNLSSKSEEEMGAGGEPVIEAQAVDAELKNDAKKMSAFEAARKKEHDMEQERARKAREEQQKRLDEMVPTRAWSRPVELVLPAECRVDRETVLPFSVVDERYRHVASRRRQDGEVPQSPPPELRSAGVTRLTDADVPQLTLSDTASDGMEVVSSGAASFTVNNTGHDGHRVYGNPADGSHRAYNNNVNGVVHAQGRGEQFGAGNTQRPPYMAPHHGGHHGTPVSGVSEPIPRPSGVDGNFLDKNNPVPPHAMQYLLSALQSSGLLNNLGNNHNRSGGDRFGADQHRMERKGRGDMYAGRVAGTGQNGTRRNGDGGANEAYLDESRRRSDREDIGMSGSPGMAPPPPMLGHGGPIGPGPGFAGGMGQAGMMDGFPFGMGIPPPPPPGMGIPPNMLPMPPPMGLGMPPMGMPPMGYGMPPGPMMNGPGSGKGSGKGGKGGAGGGRAVETITRPKSKGLKQRKKCKYFGTKQGCRDGNSCIFAHN